MILRERHRRSVARCGKASVTSRTRSPMRSRSRKVLVGILALFLSPLVVHAALSAREDRAQTMAEADWSSVGMLPPASAEHEPRLLVFAGRLGSWRGIFGVHSWVVYKPEGAATWTRYDVMNWGRPVHHNGWAPDGRWSQPSFTPSNPHSDASTGRSQFFRPGCRPRPAASRREAAG